MSAVIVSTLEAHGTNSPMVAERGFAAMIIAAGSERNKQALGQAGACEGAEDCLSASSVT